MVVLALDYSSSKNAVEIFYFMNLLAPYAFCAMAGIMIFFTDREKCSGKLLGGWEQPLIASVPW